MTAKAMSTTAAKPPRPDRPVDDAAARQRGHNRLDILGTATLPPRMPTGCTRFAHWSTGVITRRHEAATAIARDAREHDEREVLTQQRQVRYASRHRAPRAG